MSTMAEIVEADIDWMDGVAPAFREPNVLMLTSAFGLESVVQRAVTPSAPGRPAGGRPGDIDRPPRRPSGPGIGTRILNEVHDLLCSNDKYVEERTNLLKEYKAGQTAFVAGVAVTLAPHLGMHAELLSAGIAVVLSVIGQVGLKTWCGAQGERRERDVIAQKAAKERYELELAQWKERQSARELRNDRSIPPPPDPDYWL